MNRPNWQMVPVPSLRINDVIMTSLLLLKIIFVKANFGFYQTAYCLSIFSFMATLTETWIVPINSTI